MIGRRTSVATRRTDAASAVGRDRETGLDDVHTKTVELAGELQFLVRAHREARGLFAVPESRVEDNDAVVGHQPSLSASVVVTRSTSSQIYIDYNLIIIVYNAALAPVPRIPWT